MDQMPSFAEFAAPKYHRRLLVLGACAVPALWFLGAHGAAAVGSLFGWRRFTFGVPPEYLRFAAPIAWIAAFVAASWIVSWRTALSKHVYRVASALAVVAGLATSGLAFYASTAKLDDAAWTVWLIAGVVAAALGAASLYTSRKRMDWQLYGMA